MNRSELIETLAEALAKAQLAFLPVKQTERVDYSTTSGRKKYSYAPLSEVLGACRKALSDNGLSIMQMPGNDNDKIILETILFHKSGQWVSSTLGLKPVNYDPQTIGSLITYLRRYSISAMLGISADEDDDGNAGTIKGEQSATSGQQQEKGQTTNKEHWCTEHNCEFWKRGKMKSYAHIASDTVGPDGERVTVWCHERTKADAPEAPKTGMKEPVPSLPIGGTGGGPALVETVDEAVEAIMHPQQQKTKLNWPLVERYARAMNVTGTYLPKALGLSRSDLGLWQETQELALDTIEQYARAQCKYVGPAWRVIKLA